MKIPLMVNTVLLNTCASEQAYLAEFYIAEMPGFLRLF